MTCVGVCRQIGPRSHVWCEKDMVEKAAWEFEEVGTLNSLMSSMCDTCGRFVRCHSR